MNTTTPKLTPTEAQKAAIVASVNADLDRAVYCIRNGIGDRSYYLRTIKKLKSRLESIGRGESFKLQDYILDMLDLWLEG